MFCKNCGNKLDDNEKFCPSCGTPNQQGENNYTAPKPFEKNSVDESQNYQYQKSAFKGKQVSAGTSGSIGFGSKRPKKKSFLGRIIKLVIILVVIIFVATWIFGGNDPVYDISFSNTIDFDNNPINPTKDFLTTDQDIVVSFSIRNLEIGTSIYVEWYYLDGSEEWILFDTQISNTQFDEQRDYFGQRVTAGWDIGDYQVRFEVDGDEIATENFSVE